MGNASKPISFAPLDFDQALTALLQVKPAPRKLSEKGTVVPKVSESRYLAKDED